MKIILCILILFTDLICCYAQKQPLDSSVYSKWPSVVDPAISNDGKYILYYIREGSIFSKSFPKLIIQARTTNWKLEIPHASNALFTPDSRRVIYIKSADTLVITTLDVVSEDNIPQVHSFTIPKEGTGEWLTYQLNGPSKNLVVRNLFSGSENRFANIGSHLFSNNGKVLVLQKEPEDGSIETQSLYWVVLANYEITRIWNKNPSEQETKVSSILFDKSETQLAFTLESIIDKKIINSIWYYKEGTPNSISLANDYSDGIDPSLKIDRLSPYPFYQGFSRDGNRLFFSLKEMSGGNPNPGAAKIKIWSYRDAKLQSQQVQELATKTYAAVMDINVRKIIRLQYENEKILISSPNNTNYDIALVEHRDRDSFGSSEDSWNSTSNSTWYIISTKDGNKNLIRANTRIKFNLSPEGKYLIYFDPKLNNYFSYSAESGVLINITKSISTVWYNYKNARPALPYGLYNLAAWLKNDTSILLYDQYDVWKVDPSGHQSPVNLTNGYGRKHNIEFKLAIDSRFSPLSECQKLLLIAYNRETKDNGFYCKTQNKGGNPEQLIMGPYIYYVPNVRIDIHGAAPIKAKNDDIYIVQRMSATESANYYWTNDFKTLTRLSNVHPESDYNWFKTELHRWKTLDGSNLQGVLFKPDNFDPTKKYPIIFYYYETVSDMLNAYVTPRPSQGWLNIAYFVSNGYLVFASDIQYKIGYPGESAFNSVVSAAKYLSKIAFVDSTKMGIQSFSFGGFETNYIVTHTKIFTAACSGAGVSDLISYNGEIRGDGGQSVNNETGQLRIGSSLWGRQDLYLKNSPVLLANKVTTPLLMMHTSVDDAAPFSQAVEFFTALRRVGKKVWLLEYEDGNHGIWGKSADDFSIRMTQFFDHYLKGAPAPKWMLDGIPAKMKGIDDGLELVKEKDKNGNWITAGPGLLTPEEQKKVDVLKKRKSITIKL